ncbi:MAG: ABC transporter ATP-binding protein [Rhodospirillales bacterium]|nr:ABC transporter ATP-binding protein [Rhodospirillales bacterium]
MAVLLQATGLKKHFPLKRGLFGKSQVVHAVDGVDFEVAEGETLGLVGESGSGKSTIGQMVVRLLQPTSGTILYRGRDIAHLSPAEALEFTREVQIVFQDPYSSLNPHKTVGQTLARPFRIHGAARNGAEIQARILDVLRDVGLNEAFIGRYPHEMSGGERQRVCIARAIALRPKLVVADEAVSSLDVSIRAQLLNLLKDLQRKYSLAYLFITHDLATLRSVAHRVAVLYLGKLMEIGTTEDVIRRPSHPYTRALLASVPIPDPVAARKRTASELGGSIPSPVEPPPGCRFHTRCPEARDVCRTDEPALRAFGAQRAACIPDVVERLRAE